MELMFIVPTAISCHVCSPQVTVGRRVGIRRVVGRVVELGRADEFPFRAGIGLGSTRLYVFCQLKS